MVEYLVPNLKKRLCKCRYTIGNDEKMAGKKNHSNIKDNAFTNLIALAKKTKSVMTITLTNSISFPCRRSYLATNYFFPPKWENILICCFEFLSTYHI